MTDRDAPGGTPGTPNNQTPSPTSTPSPTPSPSPSPAATGTPGPAGTPTPTGAGTPGATPTGTPSPTATGTPVPANTPTATPTPAGSPTPSATGTPASTATPAPGATRGGRLRDLDAYDADWEPGRPLGLDIDRLHLDLDGDAFDEPVTLRLRVLKRTGKPFGPVTTAVDPALTATPVAAPSPTGTVVPTPMATPSPTGTPTASPTGTPTLGPTPTTTPSPTATPAPTGTPTLEPSPTSAGTPLPTGTPIPTGTPTPGVSPTGTASTTPAGTPSPTGTPLGNAAPPTGTPTSSPTATGTPTATSTPTPTATSSASHAEAPDYFSIAAIGTPVGLPPFGPPTSTPGPTPPATGTPGATPSATAIGTPSPTDTPTATPIPTAAATGMPTGTSTPGATPTGTPSPTGTPPIVPTPVAATASTTPVPEVPGHLVMPFVVRIEAEGKLTKRKHHRLRRPVRLTLDLSDLDPKDWGDTYVQLYHFDEPSQTWQVVPAQTDMALRRIVADVGHFSDFAPGGNVNELPTVPPGLDAFTVDLCSGYTQASIGLKVPPGIGGVDPTLTLVYNSGTTDAANQSWVTSQSPTFDPDNKQTQVQASPVGFGWSLDLGAVLRTGKRDAGGNPTFTLVHGGRSYDLLWVDGVTFRTKPDEFLRVRKVAASVQTGREYWLIEGKGGTQYRYGYNQDSEQLAGRYQFNGNGVQLAWQWCLDQVTDLHGNTMNVMYTEVKATPGPSFNDPVQYDQGAYVSQIAYTTNGTFAANRWVLFTYDLPAIGPRTDLVADTTLYTQYYWTKRLDKVETFAGGTAPDTTSFANLARRYVLTYVSDTPTWHTPAAVGATAPYPTQLGKPKLLLSKIEEVGTDGASKLPATVLTYHAGSAAPYRLQLNTVANGYGGTVAFTYGSHTPDGWFKLPVRYRVTQQSVDPGTGSAQGVSSVITRAYGYGPSYNVANEADYRGHAWVTVTDAAGHYGKSYFYTRDALAWTSQTGTQVSKTQAEVTVLKTKSYASERWASGATSWTTREETDWTYTPTQAGSMFLHVDETRSFVRTKDGASTHNRKTRWTYDAYGNVTSVKEYVTASASPDVWARNTVKEYYPTVGNRYIVGALAREVLYQPNGDAVRDTRYCYDGSTRHDNPIGSGLYGDDGSFRGRLTAVRRVLDPNRCVDATYGYDSYGHQTSTTVYGGYGTPGGALASVDPRTTSVTFDSQYQTLPVVVTNPLGQTASRQYDAKLFLPIAATDPNQATSTYTYDVWGRLTGALGPTIAGPTGDYRSTTQYSYGQPTPSTGGRWTTVLKKQVRTDTGGLTPTWLRSWSVYDGIGRTIQGYADAATGQVNVSNAYFDQRGLGWRSSVPHFSTGSDAFLEADWANYLDYDTRPTYDELGRVTQVTLPGGSTTRTVYDGWHTEGIDQNSHKQRYERDWAGRMVAVKEYTGTGGALTPYAVYATTSYGYDVVNELTSVVDAVGNRTSVGYDRLGRKLQLQDPDMGLWTYEYDALGQLAAQTDALEQRIEFYYDKLGRSIRTWYPMKWVQDTLSAGVAKPCVYDLMELRAAVDTNRRAAGLSAGTWTDPEIVAGTGVPVRAAHFTELQAKIQDLWTKAGMGLVPAFTAGPVASTRAIANSDLADLRGWLDQYEQQAPSWRARVWQEYDDPTVSNSIGRRTAMWDASGHSTAAYDPAGRPTSGAQWLDGHAYTSSGTYDAASRVYQATLPDGEVLRYAYGPNGLFTGLAGAMAGVSTTYVADVTYTPLASARAVGLGSGASATQLQQTFWGLDAPGTPYGALKGSVWQQGTAAPFVSRGLADDPTGNVTTISDAVTGQTASYAYDDLDRLIGATGPVAESYSYDAVGNLVTKAGQGYTYGDVTHPHAVTSFAGASYAYDANGSMVSRPSQALVYDPLRRPVRADANSRLIARFAYDGDGARRKRLDRNGTVHYLGVYERNVGNGTGATDTVSKYYYALGCLVAFRKNGALHWIGTDHQRGTLRVVADGTFQTVEQFTYGPFGVVTRSGSGALVLDRLYTGQTWDDALGLYWYGSRAYDPALGRFLQADTVVPSLSDPQALNRYTYAGNNPVRFIDPTGHDRWAADESFYEVDPTYYYPPSDPEPPVRDNWETESWATVPYVSPEDAASMDAADVVTVVAQDPSSGESSNAQTSEDDSGDTDPPAVDTLMNTMIETGVPPPGGISVTFDPEANVGNPDTSFTRGLLSGAEQLDTLDFAVTSTFAAVEAVVLVTQPEILPAVYTSYAPFFALTTVTDVAAWGMTAWADVATERTSFKYDANGIEARIGHDTLMSSMSAVIGGVPDPLVATIFDAWQIQYDASRSRDMPGYSVVLRLSW